MFLHSLFYALKIQFRTKSVLFWSLLFPIILATMFYFSFSGLSENEALKTIPVAVVLNDSNSSQFQEVIDSLSEAGENQLLNPVYTTEDEAMSLLEKKEIVGILYCGSPATLTISAEMSTLKLEQSILNSFVEQYNMSFSAIETIATDQPENLPAVIQQFSKDTNYNLETSYTDGNMDESLTHFFNLIAMSCLFASMNGMQTAINNQANLSTLAARKGISPVHKISSLLSELLSSLVFQFTCVFISLLYLIYILKIDFGGQLGYVSLASLVGCLTGISYGFFIGCIGKLSEATKMGILMAVTMLFCFLSGLMVGSMRVIIAQFAPWFNHINPAALISDSFYALTVFQSHTRYYENIGFLLLLSVVFYIGGFIMVRREKYAAL